MQSEIKREFYLDGLCVKISSHYDARCKRYIDALPDFEEHPIYTPNGRRIVSAVQDSCGNAEIDCENADCGSCKFYSPEHPGDLVGVCMHTKSEFEHKCTDKEEFPE